MFSFFCIYISRHNSKSIYICVEVYFTEKNSSMIIWCKTELLASWAWFFKIKCVQRLSAGCTELHPSRPHNCSHHGSYGCWPSGPAGTLWVHDPGATGCPGSILRHATSAATAVLPSSHEPCNAQDQYGGGAWGTNRRRHTGIQHAVKEIRLHLN